MSNTATETPATTETPKAPKPPVLDSKGTALELGMRVKSLGDLDDSGKPRLATVTGLEYQRQRAVIQIDGEPKGNVRPAAKLWVSKTKAGKIERVERAVRAGKAKAAETTTA